jgi:hypothetical protein
LVTGEYPGDGKPKPVRFPEPLAVSVERDGIAYLNLPTLVELKIASGMSNPDRLKDLADVQEVIKILKLDRGFSAELNPFVREKFEELWRASQPRPKRYLLIWRNKFLTLEAGSLEDMVSSLHEAAATLEHMRKDGVFLDPDGGTADDYAYLVTTDPEVAQKYDMHEEAEFLPDDDEEEDAPDGSKPV